ncbi:MAG: uracil-DNA glycosylase [Planctomycetota bacterium]|nr:MAG: uracil-DNA glycosylase [Planctomycetota bacterium]
MNPKEWLRFYMEMAQWFGVEGLYFPSAKEPPDASSPPAQQGRAASEQGEKGEVVRAQPSLASAPQAGLFGEEEASELLVVPTEDRRKALHVIEEAVANCTKCPLAQTRTKVVPGVGDPHAQLMLIGEAPGAQEDKRGLPFVGPAGQLLTKMLSAIQIQREAVYITNVVKCRPPRNRDPQPEEIASCRPFLQAQLRLISPKVILALGAFAARTILSKPPKVSLSSLRGKVWELHSGKLLVIATYHPSALLRYPQYKKLAWQDLQLLQRTLSSLSSQEA